MVSLTPARIKEVTQCDVLLYIRSYLTLIGLYYYDTRRLSRQVDSVHKIPYLFCVTLIGALSSRIHCHVLVDDALKLIRILKNGNM